MEFVCKRKVKYEGLETWDGTIEIVSVKRSLIETIIQGRGSTMRVLIGDYSYGHFVCIPDLNVGCPFASWGDEFWNYERLSQLMNPVDAKTVVSGVAALMEKNDECIFDC